MNPLRRKHLIAGALLAGFGAAASAQPAPAAPGASAPMTPGPRGHGFDPARMAERVNRHLADLKQKLQLTPAQEPAWTTFSAAMQPPATPPQRPDWRAMESMSTPLRIDQMRAVRDRRNAEMDRRAEATKAFYAQLTPQQQKTFDDESARMFKNMGRHMREHGPMGGQR